MSILKRIGRWLGFKIPDYIEVWVIPKKPVGYAIPSMGGYSSVTCVTVLEPDYLNMRKEIWVMP